VPETEILPALLGGGLLAGAAMLVRAFAHRGTARTDDWEQTVSLTEKLLARRTREAEQHRQRAERLWDELARITEERDTYLRELRAYRRRFGDLSDPNLPKVEGP
jgi:hypothetical protein